MNGIKIRDEYRGLILDEFGQVSEQLKAASKPSDFLYYFSAAFGILNRIMNLECNPTLVFMHQGLQSLHQAVQARSQAGANNPGDHMVVPQEFLAGMASILEDLRAAFLKNSTAQIHHVLERAANLAYATTGNGYYLYIRKKLRLQ